MGTKVISRFLIMALIKVVLEGILEYLLQGS
jgi:hypothetical protein